MACGPHVNDVMPRSRDIEVVIVATIDRHHNGFVSGLPLMAMPV